MKKTSGLTKKLTFESDKVLLNLSSKQIKMLRLIALEENISIAVLIHKIFKDELKRRTGEDID